MRHDFSEIGSPTMGRTLPWFFRWHYLVVLAYLFGVTFFHGPGIARLFGVAVAAGGVFLQLNRRTSLRSISVMPEVKFYVAWAMWSILTGLLVADVPMLVIFNAKMAIQLSILLLACNAIFVRQKNFRYFIWGIILIAIIQVVATKLGFSWDRDSSGLGDVVRDTMIDEDKTRVEGLTGNANAMGFAMINGIWACMALWQGVGRFKKIVFWPIFIGLMVLFTTYTIQTGSRKSLLVLGMIVMIWTISILPGRFSIKSFLIAAVMLVIVIVGGMVVVNYILDDTLMGRRIMMLFDDGGGNAVDGFKHSNIRYLMYVDGLKMWLEHPIFGVGLGNFVVHFFSGHFSHSDYIEPLACNGIVGFVLYHGMAFSITRRLVRLIWMRLPDEINYVLKCMLMFMICNHYFIGFGTPFWSSITHNVIVIFIGAYSWKILRIYVKREYLYME